MSLRRRGSMFDPVMTTQTRFNALGGSPAGGAGDGVPVRFLLEFPEDRGRRRPAVARLDVIVVVGGDPDPAGLLRLLDRVLLGLVVAGERRLDDVRAELADGLLLVLR